MHGTSCQIRQDHGDSRSDRPTVDRIPPACSLLASFGSFWGSVRLAVGVVPWHTFNLLGFGAVDFEACHSKDQGSRSQAETFSFDRCSVDFACKALTLAANCHYRSLSKVRDEKSHIHDGAAYPARGPIERCGRMSPAVESIPQARARQTIRGRRPGRTSGRRRLIFRSTAVMMRGVDRLRLRFRLAVVSRSHRLHLLPAPRIDEAFRPVTGWYRRHRIPAHRLPT